MLLETFTGFFALTFLCNLVLIHEVKQEAAASFPFTRFLSALALHLVFLTALYSASPPFWAQKRQARTARAQAGRAGPGRAALGVSAGRRLPPGGARPTPRRCLRGLAWALGLEAAVVLGFCTTNIKIFLKK